MLLHSPLPGLQSLVKIIWSRKAPLQLTLGKKVNSVMDADKMPPPRRSLYVKHRWHFSSFYVRLLIFSFKQERLVRTPCRNAVCCMLMVFVSSRH